MKDVVYTCVRACVRARVCVYVCVCVCCDAHRKVHFNASVCILLRGFSEMTVLGCLESRAECRSVVDPIINASLFRSFRIGYKRQFVNSEKSQ